MNKSIYDEALKIINRNTFEFGLGVGKGLRALSPDERTKIEQALTPPTADEVCKALSEWVKGNIPDIWNYKVYYDNGGFHYYNSCDFEEYLVEYEQIDKTITLSVFLPPHLITMIGRFYESLREDEK